LQLVGRTAGVPQKVDDLLQRPSRQHRAKSRPPGLVSKT
jgi:hypothetical protein